MPQTTVNMTKLATDIARNLGTEFPAPATEMPGRQYLSLVEEADELDSALVGGDLHELRGELADTLITVYLMAHYLPEINLVQELTFWGQWEALRPPSFYAAKLAKPLRRALGYARTPGGWHEVAIKLAHVELAVRTVATQTGVDLDVAVADKTRVIFSRGWRETAVEVMP